MKISIYSCVVSVSLLGLAACSSKYDLCVKDLRQSNADTSRIDFVPVITENDRRAALVTPVKEYFASVGLPDRVQQSGVSSLTTQQGGVYWLGHQTAFLKSCKKDKAIGLVAYSSASALGDGICAERRCLWIPLRKNDGYPDDTKSLILTISDDGLRIVPSSIKMPKEPQPKK